MENNILAVLDEAFVLGSFKSFCDKNSSIESKQRLRNILSRTTNPINTIKQIIGDEMGNISDIQAIRMHELITAFLNKSSNRKKVSIDEKKRLLALQNYKCKFCGCNINESDHLDHKVPFVYVGDELKNNKQMLCSHCNKKKNKSLYYQIKVYLNLN